ncbi:MAG: hypothetical protein NUV42_02120 [Candidatus Yonathbacteria bacterium]|nr:hypothetical protein [Candidatus Yonathbacteria bacterium]
MGALNEKFEKEVRLVIAAMESERGENELAKYLRPLTEEVARKYIDDYTEKFSLSLTEEQDREAFLAGWKLIHFGIKKYYERIDEMKKGDSEKYDFSEYMTWFIKQGVHKYLRELKEKQSDINEGPVF